jgi:methyl-accepting chemotaxis protein
MLKWKLIAIFAVLIAIVSLSVMSWVGMSFEQYVRNAEIGLFRNAVIAALRIEAKNYYTSRDDRKFHAAIEEVKRMNSDLQMVFLTDEEGNIIGDDAGMYEQISGAFSSSLGSSWHTPVDFDTNVEMEGGQYVMVSYKGELDPYAMHFGFGTDVIKRRTRDLSQKVAFVVGLTAAVTILLGAAFMHIAIRPIEQLARDAERLSLGDMQVRLKRGRRNEVGRIYGSLSRLKESILYSLKRFDMR